MSDFRDNSAAHQFELDAPEGMSFATYRDRDGARAILHVETPETARGKGYASKLMDAIVAHARAHDMKLKARCAYAAAYLARHPGVGDVMD